MTTLEEIRLLAAQLKEVQESVTICRLSERTWVDVIQHLVSTNRLQLVYTNNGRSFLTTQQLDLEIRSEVESHSGRIALYDLASNLDIDLDIVESRVAEMIAQDSLHKTSNRLIGIPCEVLSDTYTKAISHEIADLLSELGHITIGELATSFGLPTTFISTLISTNQGTLFRVQKHGERYFTDTFLNMTRSKVRGYFTAVMRPVTLSSVAKKLQITESLLNSIISSLLTTDRLNGQLIAGRGTFVPNCYEQVENDYVTSFFTQNGYVEWSYLKRFGVTDPGSFLKSKFPDATHASGVTVVKYVSDQLKILISQTVRDSSWVELSHCFPAGLDSCQRAALLSPLTNDLPLKCINDSFIVANDYVQKCEAVFDEFIDKMANLAFLNEKTLLFSSSVQGKTTEGDSSAATKRSNSSAKGGFGFGAREVKNKNVKKKYNPSKRRNETNSRMDDENQGASSDFQTTMTTLTNKYLSFEDIRNVLASNLPKDIPDDVIDGIIELLFPSLEQSFKKALNVRVSRSAGSVHRELKSQTEQLISNMILSVQLIERGIGSVNRSSLQNELFRHHIKTHCSYIVQSVCEYISSAYGLPWSENESEFLSGATLTDSTCPYVFSKTFDVMHPDRFQRLVELLKHTGLRDAISVSKLLQSVVDELRVKQDVTSLKPFFTVMVRLTIDELGLNIPSLHPLPDSKREREERAKANELALQLEISLNEVNSIETIKSITNATLAATCLVAQVITGWPVTAPGKCVPELLSWMCETLQETQNDVTNSSINTLRESSVLEDLKTVTEYIADQIRSPEVQINVSHIKQLLKNISLVLKKCRKQLYS